MKYAFLSLLVAVSWHARSAPYQLADSSNASPAEIKRVVNISESNEQTSSPITFLDKFGHAASSVRYGSPFFARFKVPASSANPATPARIDQKELLLVINNMPFPEYAAKQLSIKNDSAIVLFTIDHHHGEGLNLAKFLGRDRTRQQEIYIDVAKRNGERLTTTSSPITIIFFTNGGRITVIVTAVILIIAMLVIAYKSNLLKEKVNPTAVAALTAQLAAVGATNSNIPDYRWSLAKTQLAVWTITIAILYFLVWVISEGIPVINTTVLALLGISFGTTAAASLQKSPKTSEPSLKSNFLIDLIDDGSGPSIHRFQNVVFIAIFLCIFISSTYTKLEFPEFDTTQLLLLGISAAGYVGIKFLKEGQ
ncbi:hypothetical protein WBG78_30535 [Chryseolinea sp. T2]|uniref:hypothetical protein n=1 Tax=Chryseolinea sp. T2 TaxID=3129255 RepID=UPI0030786D75